MPSHEGIELHHGDEGPLNPEFTAVKPYMLSAMRSMADWGIKNKILMSPSIYLAQRVQDGGLLMHATEQYDPSYFESFPLQIMVTGEYVPEISRNAVFAGTRVILQAPDFISGLDVTVLITRALKKYPDELPISHIRVSYRDAACNVTFTRTIGGPGLLRFSSAEDQLELTIGYSGIPLDVWPPETPQNLRPVLENIDVAMAKRLMLGLISAGTPPASTMEEHDRRVENLLQSVVPAR